MKNTGSVLTIPKKMTKGEELIVLTRREYENSVCRSREILGVLKIIAEGEQAYREGNTISASSLDEALKIYAKR
jgi:hypothetical protein